MDQVNHFDISLLAKFALVKESIIKGGTNNALKLKPCLTHLLTKFLKIRGRRNHTCPPDPAVGIVTKDKTRSTQSSTFIGG